MEPVLKNEITEEEKRVFQVKWDGIRLIIHINKTKSKDTRNIHIHTKAGKNKTATYPELYSLYDLFRGDSCILDGEVITMNEQGLPSFYDLLKRNRIDNPNNKTKVSIPISYIVFDILKLNGEELFNLTLDHRFDILTKVLDENKNVKIIENIEDGIQLFDSIKKIGLEGIVSKEKEGLYHPGKRHPTWHKIKNFQYILAIVGGMVYENSRPKSLILGVKKGNHKLLYIGRALTGLNEKDLKLLDDLAFNSSYPSPFSNEIKLTDKEKARFLPPVISAKIKFLGWTPENTMRAPVIVGFIKG